MPLACGSAATQATAKPPSASAATAGLPTGFARRNADGERLAGFRAVGFETLTNDIGTCVVLTAILPDDDKAAIQQARNRHRGLFIGETDEELAADTPTKDIVKLRIDAGLVIRSESPPRDHKAAAGQPRNNRLSLQARVGGVDVEFLAGALAADGETLRHHITAH